EEAAQGRWERAERRLKEAARACASTGLAFRCARVHRQLMDLYVALHRPNDAHRHAFEGLRLAREAREWKLERELLQGLAQISRFRNGRSLAHAYLEESLSRDPADCVQQAYVHEELAAVDLVELRRTEAREEMSRAVRASLGCNRPLSLSGALVLAELARAGGLPDDERALRQALDAVHARRASPGERVLATAIEGRFELERDRPKGLALLQRAASDAEPLGGDVNALKARALAYTALTLDAGKAGAFGQALELLTRQLRTDAPRGCVLGVMVDDERTLLVARGSDGEVLGHYDQRRTRPLENELSGLVPSPILQALERGCERVAVLAPPPVNGRAGLLPSHLAWSYRLGTARPERPSRLPERRLVVANVKPPEALRLEPLRTWAGGEAADALVLLSGAQATPSRVMEEMRSSTEIEVHAHGLLDPEISDASLLALSPDDSGRYALTAGELRQAALEGAPLVLLAACEAAHTAPQLHQPYSLPAAFLQAGARVVLAATVKIPDDEAPRFFDAVRARIRAGAPPAVAVRDERQAWLARQPAGGTEHRWVEGVLVFE
ncbi:MAG TPA: CHAT domain-containing protein, partial [Longimicrobium sp.]|nr:CHAT domain-containing protein [Longimicrobium sp.]